MKKIILMAVAVILSSAAYAQNFKHSGSSASDVTPKGWLINYEPTGDLNKDGLNDLVIMATPDSIEHIITRTDGSKYNNNHPVLAIYWGTAEGKFTLYKEYPTVLEIFDDELMSMDGLLMENTYEIYITDRGVLRIKDYEDQAGSIVITTEKLYRYQNGDFELIGEQVDTYDRDTQSAEEVSYNYSTGKVKFTNYYMADDKDDEVSWGTCPKSPKKKLGQK